MIVVALVVVALVIAYGRHRLDRKQTLNGLNGERPVFHVEPPTRRLGDRRRELL